MSLAQTQAALARLFTQSDARALFAEDPQAAARAAGLDGAEAEAFAQTPPAEIARYAASLAAKRRLDVAKWLPRTAEALGEAFGPLLRETLAEPPPGSRADALALALRLREPPAPLPPWIGELADYESRFVGAWGPWGHFGWAYYRWPVPRLANGGAGADMQPAATLALWARWPGGRLRHVWRIWETRDGSRDGR